MSMSNEKTIFEEILAELDRADAKYPHDPMTHPKVGLLTIKCEVTELEREVERPVIHPAWMKKECIQSAAMCVKFLRDICGVKVC